MMRSGLLCSFLCFLMSGISTVWADEALPESTLSAGITTTLYADGPYVDVLKIAADGPWLYVAVRDNAGAQYIDVWRVTPPVAPELVDTIVYPNLATAPFAFTPLAIIPRNGVVLIQAEETLRSYRHDSDGSLLFIEELNLVTGLGVPSMGRLSAAGAFASHTQQVVPNQNIGEVSADEIHQEVVLSLRDPAHPFLVRASEAGGYSGFLNTDHPVNAVYQGMPASIAYDSQSRELALSTFERTVQSHLNTFWDGKLDGIFVEGALDLSIQEHIGAALATIDLPALRAEILAEYLATLDIDGISIEGMIRDQHLGTDSIEDVLATHRLSLDESLELSLRKLATEALDESLRESLGRVVFTPVLEAWLDETFGIAWDGLSSAEIAAEVAIAFDAELDTEGTVRYLTLEVIAPLLDDPDFMTWTLDDLVDAIVDSDLGAAIDVALTVTGVGLIGEVLGIIDDLPGFSLPDCALFPGNARGLIDIALYSGGAELDGEGLAWFEMLKLYQYLTGGVDFETYTAEIDAALRSLHFDLAEDFTDKYVGFFAGVEGFDLSDDVLAGITEYAPVDQVLGDLLAHALMERLETAGFETDVTLREFFESLSLPFDLGGNITADIDGLVESLEIDGLRVELVASVFAWAETVPINLGGYLEAYLNAQIEAVFGVAIPDLNLRAALYLYLTEQFDLSTSLGGYLEGVLDNFVLEVQADVLFGAYLTTLANAFDGDCIAQWMVGLDIATGISTPLLLEAYPLAAKAALSAGYDAAISGAISVMFSLVADVVMEDLSGHWASWTEQVVETKYQFDMPSSDGGYDITVAGEFLWEDRVVLVLSYRSQAAPFDLRPVYLETFQPDAPEATRKLIDLGLWEKVDFVAQAGKDLYLSGRHSVGDEFAHGLLLDLDRMEGRKFTGDDFLPLAVTEEMAAIDRGTTLAMRGVGRVTLVPNLVPVAVEVVAHVGDSDANGRIDLSELLRVIQLYNSSGYYCAASVGATEDGYVPGVDIAAQSCTPHASDYNPQNWAINLSELLRFIQFYNSGGYEACDEGEDQFCPVGLSAE